MTTEQEIRRVLKKLAIEYRNEHGRYTAYHPFDEWLQVMPIEEEKEEILGTANRHISTGDFVFNKDLIDIVKTKKKEETKSTYNPWRLPAMIVEEKEDLKLQVIEILRKGSNRLNEDLAEEILKLINK